MRFKVKDSNLFLMPGNPHMLHLGTIAYGLREFVAMVCVQQPPTLAKSNVAYVGRCYIEEVVLESKDFSKDVYANLKFIDDGQLANDLAAFAQDKDILNIPKQLERIMTYKNYESLRNLFGNAPPSR
jgi:hypothetical protein